MTDEDDDPPDVVPEASPQSNIDAILNAYDTPTERATICKLAVDDFEAMLASIRERRLVRVQKLEALTRVKADETRLENYMRYERLVKQTRKLFENCDAVEQRAEAALHKLRIVVMAIEMEVNEDA
jgi:hypothetical protein